MSNNELNPSGHSRMLPPEIVIRERITGNGTTDLLVLGGVTVIGPSREIEIVNMRGEVLCRVPVADIAEWVERNNYRYVPRTQGCYQRDRRSPREPRGAAERS